MKFSRKLFSIVSAMSMAACVFTSPVFAEDSSTTTSAPVVDEDIETELGELAPNTVAESSDMLDESTSDALKTSDFIKLQTLSNGKYFQYDAKSGRITTSFTVRKPLSADLHYKLQWNGIRLSVDAGSVEVTISGKKMENTPMATPDLSDPDKSDNFVLEFDKKDLQTANSTVKISFLIDVHGTGYQGIQLTESAQLKNSNEVLNETDLIELNTDDSSSQKPAESASGFNFTQNYDLSNNSLTLDLALKKEVWDGKKPLSVEISSVGLSVVENLKNQNYSNKEILEYLLGNSGTAGRVLKKLKYIQIGEKQYENKWVTASNNYGYSIEIPQSYLESKISFVFETEPNIEGSYIIAAAGTDSYTMSDGPYIAKITSDSAADSNSPYSITADYIQDTNTWDLQISDKDKKDEIDAFPNTSGNTVITVASNPDVLTGITDFSIGEVGYTVASNDAGITISKKETESAPANVQAPSEGENEDTENEAGEVSVLSAKKVSNGYEITIPNADLQALKTEGIRVDFVDIAFSTKPDMTSSKMNVVVTNTDNPQAAGSFSRKIKKTPSAPSNSQTNTPGGTEAETNPVSSSASFKASHNYDSATQTWTVTLNMTARPAKLDLSFNQKQGTALLKPTSFTINNAAVSPTVNATMSGSTMSVCSVSFSQADLAKVTNGTVVKLVFPVDGSKEQSEKITMTVNTGNASKDLNASFTVKKTTNGGVPTATETGAQPLVIVLVVAVVALAVFGYLAFRKKKKN